jgi:hypothetical protein
MMRSAGAQHAGVAARRSAIFQSALALESERKRSNAPILPRAHPTSGWPMVVVRFFLAFLQDEVAGPPTGFQISID